MLGFIKEESKTRTKKQLIDARGVRSGYEYEYFKRQIPEQFGYYNRLTLRLYMTKYSQPFSKNVKNLENPPNNQEVIDKTEATMTVFIRGPADDTEFKILQSLYGNNQYFSLPRNIGMIAGKRAYEYNIPTCSLHLLKKMPGTNK